MCLTVVTSTIERKADHGYGWKVFFEYRLNGVLIPEMYGDGEPYKLGVWYEAYGNDITRIDSDIGYKPGFHVLATKKSALKWRGFSRRMYPLRKVQWRHLLARGSQLGLAVLVAKEMRILRK